MSDDFVELIGNLGVGLGLSRVACRLYGLLFITGKPLSLDEMSEKLGVSKGSVSVNIRALERWEAARRVWKKGSRKDYYRCEENIPEIAAKRLREGMGKRLAVLKDFIGGEKDPAVNRQLKKLGAYIDRAESMLELLGDENFRKFLS